MQRLPENSLELTTVQEMGIVHAANLAAIFFHLSDAYFSLWYTLAAPTAELGSVARVRLVCVQHTRPIT